MDHKALIESVYLHLEDAFAALAWSEDGSGEDGRESPGQANLYKLLYESKISRNITLRSRKAFSSQKICFPTLYPKKHRENIGVTP